MKKTIPIVGGITLLTAPLIAPVVMPEDNPNINNSKISLPSFIITDTFINNSAVLDKEPCGEMRYVTYYGKRKGSKEILDIYLDSGTLNKEDKCFLTVSVFDSSGEVEYRLDTTIIYFEVATNYIIELDPPKKENETFREVRVAATFYSNKNNHHQYIAFNVDYKKQETYTFENDIDYNSEYPIILKNYLNGKEEEIYESMSFKNMCNLKFNRPIFELEQMSFTYNYENKKIMLPQYDECYLLIDGVYEGSDIEEENEMKKIPLNLVSKNETIYFELLNKYYYDSSDGMLYQSNKSGRNETSKLLLPSTFTNDNKSVYYEIHFKNFTSSGDEMIFKSYAEFNIKWFGACGDAYFCVKSIEELLENVNYSGGITI